MKIFLASFESFVLIGFKMEKIHSPQMAYPMAAKYKAIADQEDALIRYQRGEKLAIDHHYRAAASAFAAALSFVPGFRDAGDMAEKARSFVPPNDYQLRYLVQQSVRQGIPLVWLRDVHRGYTEEVSIASVSILR